MKKSGILILVLSLLSAFAFTLLREYRFFAHHNIIPTLIEYFGYGLSAFVFSLSLFLIGFIVLYYLIRTFLRGNNKRKIIISCIIAVILLSLVYSYHTAISNQILPPIEPDLDSHKTYVVFTFDTEEDWVSGFGYYNTYKYITSGAFYQLVDGLEERNASSTFYVTPNLARDIPEVLKYLEENNQTIGAHLHVHVLENVTYPYITRDSEGNVLSKVKKEDRITSYNKTMKMKYMKLTKDQIESVIKHNVYMYRSGQLACDYETENVAKRIGYNAISNHAGIYYIEPVGIWNLGQGKHDIFDPAYCDKLGDYQNLFTDRAEHEQIITFTAHPMSIYNHTSNEIDEKKLKTFFGFIDWLKNKDNVEIINQYQLLQMVESEKVNAG